MRSEGATLQDDIERIQKQIDELERVQSVTWTQGSSSFTTSNSRSRAVFRDFTVQQEDDDEPKTSPKNSSCGSRSNKKIIAFGVGTLLVIGSIAAIITLTNFMKNGDVQFMQDDPGTAIITLEELALHNTPDDCWVAFYGDVYDLTYYARRHPGGAEFVTDLAGMDGTYEYELFHPESLLRSVEGDIVGTLSTAATSGGGNNGGESSSNNNSGSPTPAIDCANTPNCVSTEELKLHNTDDDCWIAMHGYVYDMTEYANQHPGGARVITQLAGTVGTNEYDRFHPPSLLLDVQNTLIGPYEGGTEAGGGVNSGSGQYISSESSGD